MDRVSETVKVPGVARSNVTYDRVRRGIDLFGSAVLLILLAPVMAVIGVVIAADSGLPVFYRCERLGRRGRTITMLKFRSMRADSHHHLAELLANDEEKRQEYETNRKLKEDPRRTRVGGFLRKSSLDELPQLWNILRGDMTLIGPRPYLLHELDGRPERDLLLSVRPGLTGLWQTSGRSDRTFEERIALEVEYVEHRSARLDLRILRRTIGAVTSARGAY